jgi:nitrate reductase assembly molybdenum cofactor insertion protein NarJ
VNRRVVEDAATWRLLSCLLERPRPGWSEEVGALAREVPSRQLAACAERVARRGTEGEYLALLGPGGRISPREVTYRPTRDPGVVLARLRALYEAFAFFPTKEEPSDHIAVELSFLGYLKLKEVFAAVEQNPQAVSTVQEALLLFQREHLDGFLKPFAGALAATEGYLAAVGRILVTVPGPDDPFIPEDLSGDCPSHPAEES